MIPNSQEHGEGWMIPYVTCNIVTGAQRPWNESWFLPPCSLPFLSTKTQMTHIYIYGRICQSPLASQSSLMVPLWSCLYVLLSSGSLKVATALCIHNCKGGWLSLDSSPSWPPFFCNVSAIYHHNNPTQQTIPKHQWHIKIYIYWASEPELFHWSGQFPHISGTWLAFGCSRVASAGPAGATQLPLCLSAFSRLVQTCSPDNCKGARAIKPNYPSAL